MAHTRKDLNAIYAKAAQKAFEDKVDPGNEAKLIEWIENNCSFQPQHLYFLVIGIGAELADIQACHEGYENQVDKIWKEKITPKFEQDRFGGWHRKATGGDE